jgi:HPr kinase/phosphorylase
LWAEVMEIYWSTENKSSLLKFSKEMEQEISEYRKQFTQEDTMAGMIQGWLDAYKGSHVCSVQIWKEAFDHFDRERVQIIGYVEQAYINTLPREVRVERYDKLLSSEIPCVVYSRGQEPDEDMQDLCLHYQVPLMVSDKSTSDLMAEVIRWLKVKLAPCISIHGVLVDVFGEGVLIMGESGIGKSEAALELIKRGHRLVSDDVVEIRKVSDATLVGSAPDITKHFIELRGIGIIDVKSLYGVESVKDTQNIDMVIKLEDWDKDKEYDRLGLEDRYTEFLGNQVVCHNIPIRPGRNLAIIVESAAVNYRQKKMGYNAAQELYNRVQANLGNK